MNTNTTKINRKKYSKKKTYMMQPKASCHQAHSQDRVSKFLCQENHGYQNCWEEQVLHNSRPWRDKPRKLQGNNQWNKVRGKLWTTNEPYLFQYVHSSVTKTNFQINNSLQKHNRNNRRMLELDTKGFTTTDLEISHESQHNLLEIYSKKWIQESTHT